MSISKPHLLGDYTPYRYSLYIAPNDNVKQIGNGWRVAPPLTISDERGRTGQVPAGGGPATIRLVRGPEMRMPQIDTTNWQAASDIWKVRVDVTAAGQGLGRGRFRSRD